MATVGQLTVKVATDISGLDRGLRSAQDRLSSFGSSLRGTGTRLTAGITAPLTGIAIMAFKSAADFEQSMNLIQTMSGGTADDMAALEQQALNLGATTVFSAGEAAGAMLELSKAGMSLDEVSAAIPGVMDLAAAGGIELADAATITSNAINAFGLDAAAATDVANTFAAAANASSADVEDLAAGFQMAGAVFAANDQSVNDLATSLAILANNGIAGSDAGTSLKTMLMRLAAPTDEAAAAMNSLGINVYDAQGKMLPFGEIIGQLESSTAGLSDEQRNAALQTIFGADAIRAATILAGEGQVKYDEMAAAVGRQGAAQEMADARMRGLGGAFEYLKGSLDSFLLGSALPFTDTLGGIIRQGADLITKLGTLSPETQRWAAYIGLAAAAAGPLLIALGAMVSVLGVLISPIGLVVAAVAALGLAWATNFGGIREKTAAVWTALQPFVQGAATWFQTQIPAALTTLSTSFTTAWDAIRAVWETLAAFLEPAIQRLQDAFGGLGGQWETLGPVVEGFLTTLSTSFASMWESVQPILQVLGATLGVIIDFGINLLATAVENLALIATPIFTQLGDTVTAFSTIVTGVLDAIVLLLQGDFSGAWAAAQTVLTGFSQYVLDTFQNLQDFIGAVFTTIYSAVVDTLADVGIDAQGVLDGITTWWETKWTALIDFVQPVIDVVNGVVDALQGAWDWLASHVFTNPFAGWDLNPFNNGAAANNADGGLNLPGRNASGTNYWRGGLTWVGERGPELVQLPRASRIFSNEDSLAMAGAAAGGGGQAVTFNVTVNQDLDWEQLRWRLQDLTKRRG